MAENLSFDQVSPFEAEQAEARRQRAAFNQLTDWVHIAVQRRLRKRKQSQLQREVRRNQIKAAAYRNMAQYAINLAAKQNVGPAKRLTRRRELAMAWQNMRQRLTFKTRGL